MLIIIYYYVIRSYFIAIIAYYLKYFRNINKLVKKKQCSIRVMLKFIYLSDKISDFY